MSKKDLCCLKKQQALTIGEFLIALGVIAALAVILVPIYKAVKPDKNDALAKKANYIVNRIVNELSTDEYLYSDDGEHSGFRNTDPVQFEGMEHGGTTKFCTLFASRIIKKPGTTVNCTPGQPSVTSSEGMDFYLPISSFDGPQVISVDVNGEEGPNCLDKSGCKNPDRFNFQVIPGKRITVNKVGFLGKTPAPPVKPAQQDAPKGPDKDSRTAQKMYSISCGASSGASIYGQGANKVNGTYTLVAVPQKGYKCSWFTKQVTIKDANVTDCTITCTPDNNIPQADGEPIAPDEKVTTCPDGSTCKGENCCPAEEKTYCINVNMTGDKEGCSLKGNGCELKPGIYTVSVTIKDGYSSSWTKPQEVTIVDKDVSLNMECKLEDNEECYGVTITGDSEHCPVALPTANCAKEEGKYRAGTYKYHVTPAKGWTYKDSPDATEETLVIGDSDQEIKIECKESTLPPIVDIYVKDTFDGLYQDQFHTSNVYYHVYAKRYFDVRTLNVEVPDVFVKLQIKGKYTGNSNSCSSYSGTCSSSGLTLNENGIESQFRQPLVQDLANGGSVRWESIQELGEGGSNGSTKMIQSVFETFTLTINDKVYAENAAWPTSSTVLEYEDKELNTVFKLHYEFPQRYIYQFTEIDMDGTPIGAQNGATSYAWINAKTNVVACAAGNCGGDFGGDAFGGNYTYFEPGAPHLAHQGETIQFRIGTPYRKCRDNRIYFPVGVFKNGSQVCSAPDWSTQNYAECSTSISGGSAFPAVNTINVKWQSCPANDSGYGCESGPGFGNFSVLSSTGSSCY